jgi:hypothetical protein
MMKRIFFWMIVLVAMPLASSWMPRAHKQEMHRIQPHSTAPLLVDSLPQLSPTTCTRRQFGESAAAATTTSVLLVLGQLLHDPSPALAIPMVTTSEFSVILHDSARSIVRVEFYNPAQVVVVLADGTRFGLSDVIESPIDPRSPLKIVAMCRENGVPTKFVDLEAALAAAPKRKRQYSNERVKEAAAKEQEKRMRMEQDEQDRLASLEQMEKA